MYKIIRYFLVFALLLTIAFSASAQLTVENPLGGNRDLNSLVTLIAAWVFYLAIPLIAIVIIYSGVRFITARGNPGEIQKAKAMLTYALIGLAIVLIGQGFITLIRSFLQLG